MQSVENLVGVSIRRFKDVKMKSLSLNIYSQGQEWIDSDSDRRVYKTLRGSNKSATRVDRSADIRWKRIAE